MCNVVADASGREKTFAGAGIMSLPERLFTEVVRDAGARSIPSVLLAAPCAAPGGLTSPARNWEERRSVMSHDIVPDQLLASRHTDVAASTMSFLLPSDALLHIHLAKAKQQFSQANLVSD